MPPRCIVIRKRVSISVFVGSSGSSTSEQIVQKSLGQNKEVVAPIFEAELSSSLCWSGKKDPSINPDVPFFSSNYSMTASHFFNSNDEL